MEKWIVELKEAGQDWKVITEPMCHKDADIIAFLLCNNDTTGRSARLKRVTI